MATNREQLIAILKRAPATTAGGNTVFNAMLDFLIGIGYADVAAAMITAFDSTSVKTQGNVQPAILAATQNLNYSGHTHHDRV